MRTVIIFLFLCGAPRLVAEELWVAVSTLPKNLDPFQSWNFQHFLVLKNVFETLVKVDAQGRLRGQLASHWKIDRQRKSLQIFLDENARFSDGTPLTSTEVAESLSAHFWKSNQSMTKAYLGYALGQESDLDEGKLLPQIQIISRSSFILKLKRFYEPILSVLSMPSFSIFKRNSKSFLGSGPMRVEKSDLPQEILLTAVKEGVTQKRIRISQKIIQDVDPMHPPDLVLGSSSWQSVTTAKNLLYQLNTLHAMSISHFWYNAMDHSLLRNAKFRRELGLHIQSVAKSIDQRPVLVFSPDFVPSGFLPNKYYSAGRNSQPDPSTSEFKKRWGKVLRHSREMRVVLRSDFYRDSFIESLKNKFADLGIKVSIKLVSAPDFRAELSRKSYDILGAAYLSNFLDPDGLMMPLDQKSPGSMGKFDNSLMMKEIAAARYQIDPDKRLQLYSAAIRKMEAQWWVVPAFRFYLPLFYKPNIEIPDMSYRYEIEFWKIRKHSQ